MFSFGGLSELLLIAIAIIILIGPKEMPVVLRACGRWIQRMRNLTENMKSHMDRYIHQGEFEEYRRQVNEAIVSEHAKNFKTEGQRESHEPESLT